MAEVKVGHISKTKFYVSIDKISELELQEVTIPGQVWSITFVKTSNTAIVKAPKLGGSNYNEKTEDVLVVNLNLENDGVKSVGWACVASLSVKLLRSTANEHVVRQMGPFVFDAKNKVCGQKLFIKWNDLLKAENGYVRNDSCKFEIEIDAGPIQNVSSDHWLKFDIIEKCCNKSAIGKFGLTINNLHESNQVCSPEIHFDNTTWRILVMKDDDKLTVSLWKVEIMPHPIIRRKEFITVLKSFDQNFDPIKKVTKTIGIHPSPLELFSMPWKDLVDPQKKFIENGSFELEIEMKMNASDGWTGEGFDLECPICLGSMFTMNRGISVTHCGHLFCTPCISTHLNISPGNNQLCPACQQVSHSIF